MDPLISVDFVLSPRGKLRVSWSHRSSMIQVNSITSPAHIHPFYEMYVYISGDSARSSRISSALVISRAPSRMMAKGPSAPR